MHDPARPHEYPRRILVCLSGLTPQVVTETLYALLTGAPAFVPTELHIITTDEGRQRAVELLLGERCVLASLWRDWAPPDARLHFDPNTHIHSIVEGDRPLSDVTARSHHIGTADSILSVLRPLVQDADSAVHASIAGGRKSMSFYMGYVMSLLAREQDRLSHVLVSAPFETLPAFAYPTADPTTFTDACGQTWCSDQAQIVLSDIAFVRISPRLPEQLLRGEQRFEGLVAQAQAALDGVRIVLDTPEKTIAVIAAGRPPVIIKLSPLEFGLYAYLAIRRLSETGDHAGLVALNAESQSGNVERMVDAGRLKQLEASLNLARGQLLTDWKVDVCLRERVSHIKRKLQKALAEPAFMRVRIFGPGERGQRDGRYGLLGLDRHQVHFGNVPMDE